MGNEKWMAAHSILLTMLLGSYLYAKLFPTASLTPYKALAAIDVCVYFLMAFIMDQVNGPQYTVWANRKFVGRN
jgi:hypothetical protein